MTAAYRDVVAVIGFSRAASPLEPAWPSTHRALLPIAGKALVVHLVERLAQSGIRHLRIAGSIQQFAVRRRLRDGSEWGVKIRYSDLYDGDLRTQTLLEHGQCLYLCADQLHQVDLSRRHPEAAFAVEDPGLLSEFPGYWKMSAAGPVRYDIAAITQRPYCRERLLTVPSYHQANLAAARRQQYSLVLPGRALRAGVFVDWDTHLASSVDLGSHITIGKHCRIDRRVRLMSRCVIGNGVVIGRDSQLSNVTVLPNTYIGAAVRLRDAVVTPVGVFDLEGRFLYCGERSVFGRVRGNAESYTGLPSEKLSVIEESWRAPTRTQTVIEDRQSAAGGR